MQYEDFFPLRLAQLRQSRNVSARDMSLTMGQSENYINMIENKKSLPSMAVFFYICEYFKITPLEFFDEGNKNPNRMNEMIEDIKLVDEEMQTHLSALIKGLKK